MPYRFTPVSIKGVAANPPYENQVCYGLDLRQTKVKPALDLSYLISLYRVFPDRDKFFNSYFEKLAGTASLRQQIIQGMDEESIRKSWEPALQAFLEKRKKYLLYD
ncbi:MAG: hypothetical protein KatS3mg032_1859 [Cyclobacteriaceae bacterium]|nr:MAG: hypothetical protein KatS3mg032_1859 [Cyclobacteriaceae bacterium]